MKINFEELVDLAMKNKNYTHMRHVIAKELLHYDILFALDNNHLLDTLTFQGGTSLRLCYGGDRFSEDLDFAGGKNFNPQDFKNIKSCLEKHIGKRYGLEISVKEPETLYHPYDNASIKVSKWQLRILTHPLRRDLPKQMIKIEIVNLDAYTKELKTLQSNYDFLPDGYSDIFVMVESLDEILADKLIAFFNCNYIRYRDIWDFRWLMQKGAKINIELIKNKIADYSVLSYNLKIQCRV
ncbi:MAG: nucleotidyl transferase AbiEii/AbiGii toxin family protein [Gammaproteobacteria bacterium]